MSSGVCPNTYLYLLFSLKNSNKYTAVGANTSYKNVNDCSLTYLIDAICMIFFMYSAEMISKTLIFLNSDPRLERNDGEEVDFL